MLDTNATRQDETVEIIDETTDIFVDASLSFVTSTGVATFGRAAKADAMREAGALCGIEAVVAPSKLSRKVPDTASYMLMSCCSIFPFARSHS